MITVGLAKELYFIASNFNQVLHASISLANSGTELFLTVFPTGRLEFYCDNKQIWVESIEGEDSFFGVESCDTISRIVACINRGDSSWEKNYPSPL